MGIGASPGEPELSTLPESGTFYFALTTIKEHSVKKWHFTFEAMPGGQSHTNHLSCPYGLEQIHAGAGHVVNVLQGANRLRFGWAALANTRLAMLGGGTGAFCARRFGKTPLLRVAILPFVVAATERWPGLAYEVREVATSIAIRATPTTVWQQIERVEPIRVEEQRFSWSQKIGFPRPIEATLSGEGVGAVRHAPRSWIHSDDCGEIAKR